MAQQSIHFIFQQMFKQCQYFWRTRARPRVVVLLCGACGCRHTLLPLSMERPIRKRRITVATSYWKCDNNFTEVFRKMHMVHGLKMRDVKGRLLDWTKLWFRLSSGLCQPPTKIPRRKAETQPLRFKTHVFLLKNENVGPYHETL